MVYVVRVKNGEKKIEKLKGPKLPNPIKDETIVLITASKAIAEMV